MRCNLEICENNEGVNTPARNQKNAQNKELTKIAAVSNPSSVGMVPIDMLLFRFLCKKRSWSPNIKKNNRRRAHKKLRDFKDSNSVGIMPANKLLFKVLFE